MRTFLRNDGQFQPVGGGDIAISTTTTTGFLTYLTATNASSIFLTPAGTNFPIVSVAQGSSGTWFAAGTVTYISSLTGIPVLYLWSSSSTAAGAQIGLTIAPATIANQSSSLSLSGIVTSPSGGITLLANYAGSAGYADIAGRSILTAIRIG